MAAILAARNGHSKVESLLREADDLSLLTRSNPNFALRAARGII
jgi:hypothetical protein